MKEKTTKEKTEDGSTASRPRQLYTGGERPIDPEDLVMASGRDVTPERVERAKRLIEEKGSAAVERYLP
ncbi:hypothetical protein FGW37_08290 [Streptomyces rectiverticillatus]|uniref:hypothetical protein n=1 Tax=Streptomyces rectiverticillatus TaxID=173860 RepID=UPI0015C32A75|nr:hypothetical protein [Streptomyces rectiverticillatus]QLE71600.1 hypothetical protein FGW37_08290 [Streptomyces rectiverticillatus]